MDVRRRAAASGRRLSAKRTLVPPMSATSTGKGKAKLVIAGHKRGTPRNVKPGKKIWRRKRSSLAGAQRATLAPICRGRMAEFTFYEFFCGGGMARAGLGPRWRCAFANDFDRAKGEDLRRQLGREPN